MICHDTLWKNLCTIMFFFIIIKTVFSLQDFPFLETLNISWNQIIKLLDCISCLKNHIPGLLNLDISHNPLDITQKDHMFYLIEQQLPGLEILNGLQMINSFVNITTLDLKNENILLKGTIIPKTLDLEKTQIYWRAEICNETCTDDATYLYEKDAINNDNCLKWISQTGKHIVDVKHSEMLKHTLWADFSHNLLCNVSFLGKGEMLQELSLAHNIIQEVGPWMHNLKNLVKLNLSYNYIRSLKGLCGSSYPSLKVRTQPVSTDSGFHSRRCYIQLCCPGLIATVYG